MNNYAKTKYPKIYKNCNWGGFIRYESNNIINNRNKFIEEFKIKKKINNRNTKLINKNLKFWNKEQLELIKKYGNKRLSKKLYNIETYEKMEKIKNRMKNSNRDDMYGMVDHLECYYTKNKEYILVISLYDFICDKDKELYNLNNWILYNQLYDNGSTTYIKIFKKL